MNFKSWKSKKKKERKRIEKLMEAKNEKAADRNRLIDFKMKIKDARWKSDIWLRENWIALEMLPLDLRTPDQFNKVSPPYIPDLINYWFKYVIECDGSVHDRADVKARDAKKDRYFRRNGFKVFRVRHGDMDKLKLIANKVRKIRQQKGAPPACNIYRG